MPQGQQYTREEVEAEARRRGLLPPSPSPEFSREEVLAEAQRRGLVEAATPDTVGAGMREQLPTFGELGSMFAGGARFLQDAASGNPLQMAGAATSLGNVGTGIVQQQGEQFDLAAEKFLEAGERPGINPRLLSEGAGRAVAGALPVIGPMAAEVGDVFGAGELKRGVGNLIGIFLPELLMGGLGKATRAAPAGRFIGDVPLTRAQRAGAAGRTVSEFAEGVAGRTIPGAGNIRRIRGLQQERLVNLANDMIDEVSAFTGNEAELRRLVQTQLDETLDGLKREASGMYDEIDRAANPASVVFETRLAGSADVGADVIGTTKRFETLRSVPTRGWKKFARAQAKRLKELSEVADPVLLTDAQRIVKAIVDAPEKVSFRVAQDFRSDLLSIARRHGDPLPGKAGGIARKLAGLTDEAMEQGARAVGGDDLVGMVRQANEQWRFVAETFNESYIRKFLDTNADNAHLLLRRAPLDEIGTIKKLVGEEGFNAMKARLLRDMLAKAETGELSAAARSATPEIGQSLFGEAGQRLGNEFPITLRGKSLQTQLESFGINQLDAVFGRKTRADFEDLARLAKRVGMEDTGLLAPSILGGFINANLVQGALRAASGDVGALFRGLGGSALTSPVGMALGINLMSRLMARPEGLIALRGYVRAMGTKAPRAMNFWSRRMAMSLKDMDPFPMVQALQQADPGPGAPQEPIEPNAAEVARGRAEEFLETATRR